MLLFKVISTVLLLSWLFFLCFNAKKQIDKSRPTLLFQLDCFLCKNDLEDADASDSGLVYIGHR